MWLFLNNLLFTILVPGVVVLLVEEPMLRRQFGASYERYTRAVRRWLPGRAWHDEP